MKRNRCPSRVARKDWKPFPGSKSYAAGNGPASNGSASHHEPSSPGSTIEFEYCAEAGTGRTSGPSQLAEQSITAVATHAFVAPLLTKFCIARFCATRCNDSSCLGIPTSAAAAATTSTDAPTASSPTTEATDGPWITSTRRSEWNATRTSHEGTRKHWDGTFGRRQCLLPVSVPEFPESY